MNSFKDDNGKQWTVCCECNRGGNGNNKDKCSCGWQCTEWNQLGCFIGSEIVGDMKPVKKKTRSQKRYLRYLEFGDCFDDFRHFLSWDGNKDHSWNNAC